MKLKRLLPGKRIGALALSLFLLSTDCGLFAMAKNVNDITYENETVSENALSGYTEEAFNINTPEDFIVFSDNCRKNSWSKGRVVNLNQDIDLKGVEFKEIPSFSGYFKGNGHTISNLSINEGDEAMGLFRYLETDGYISELTVTGYITSTDSRDIIGGIVGVNSGTIVDSVFTGKIRGVGVAGGIAGLNGGTGRIIGCENQGFIISQSNVGGIAGVNRGFISDSVNNGNVNSDSSWVDDPVDNTVDISDINTVSAMLNIGKNIGGIAGWSNGIVATCTNNGIVGYLKTGENVGGIAGCHSGSIIYCKNTGKVYGKQDVGGIAGQFEPTIVIKDIQEIKDEVDKLHDILNDSADDMDRATDMLTADLDDINDKSGNITDVGDLVSDEGLDVLEKNVDVANDFSTRADYVTNHVKPINTDISYALKDLDKINDILNKIEKDTNMSQSDKDKIKDIRNKIDKSAEDMKASSESAKKNLEEAEKVLNKDDSVSAGNLFNGDDSLKDNKEFTEKIVDAGKDLTDALVAATDIMGYVNDVYDIVIPYMDDTSDALNKDMDDLKDTSDHMLDSLTDANDLTGAVLDYLNSLDKLEIINFSSDFDKNIEKLQDEVNDTINSMDRLNKDASTHSDKLEEDIRRINDQSNLVTDLVIDRISNFEAAANGEDIIVDVSENDKNAELSASITGCENKGNVDAVSNVGGITGNISIDSSDDNKNGLGSKYEVSAIISGNRNSGFVTVKNKNAGGIAGSLVAGYIGDCESSGGIISEEGNYIGGIAGNSKGTIDNCKSYAVLAGGEYIGGIAGSADDVKNCLAMPMIKESLGRTGAILGAYQSGDDDITVYHQGMNEHIYNNFFVSDILFGIDSVSYTGVAEPVSQDEIKAMGSGFDICRVYFVDEDYNLISEMQYRFGYDLNNLRYPDVYTDTKTYAEWDKAGDGKLTSNLVLRSVVVDNVTIIASDLVKEDKAVVLAEGIFTKEAELKVNKLYESIFPGNGNESVEAIKVNNLPDDIVLPQAPVNASIEVYEITLNKADITKDDEVNIRIFQENAGKAEVYMLVASSDEAAVSGNEAVSNSALSDGQFVKVESENIGSYHQITIQGDKAYICVVTVPDNDMIIYIIAGVAAVVILILIISVASKKKRKARKSKG